MKTNIYTNMQGHTQYRDLSGKYKYLLLLILYMKISMVKGELHFKRSSVCQRVHCTPVIMSD